MLAAVITCSSASMRTLTNEQTKLIEQAAQLVPDSTRAIYYQHVGAIEERTVVQSCDRDV